MSPEQRFGSRIGTLRALCRKFEEQAAEAIIGCFAGLYSAISAILLFVKTVRSWQVATWRRNRRALISGTTRFSMRTVQPRSGAPMYSTRPDSRFSIASAIEITFFLI